jgi:CXXC-20-CXXC protein
MKVCPHCGTVYRYGDLFRMMKQSFGKDKEEVCYHCKKVMKISLLPKIIPAAALWLALSVGTNIALLSGMKELNIAVMMIVTVIYLAAFVLIVPLCMKLKK